MLLDWLGPFYPADPHLPPFSMRRFVGEARWDINGQDFSNTGRHFADKLRDAGLRSNSRILDLGSGCGRIAIPLTSILDTTGSYTGLELSAPLVEWCQSHITPSYPNFRFLQCDIRSPFYNPSGRDNPLDYRFPFVDGAFDLIVATSIFTHLLPEVAVHDMRESARVLAADGRMFATFFFIDSVPSSIDSPLKFAHAWGDHARVANMALPEFAIGFELDWIRQQTSDAGLDVEPPVRWGSWSGRREGYSWQDVLILRRRP
jgi:SAM-dependent methyltransferase